MAVSDIMSSPKEAIRINVTIATISHSIRTSVLMMELAIWANIVAKSIGTCVVVRFIILLLLVIFNIYDHFVVILTLVWSILTCLSSVRDYVGISSGTSFAYLII